MACIRALVFAALKSVVLNEIYKFKEINRYQGLTNKCSKIR